MPGRRSEVFLTPVRAVSAVIGDDLAAVAAALTTYAAEVEEIKQRLAALRTQAGVFAAAAGAVPFGPADPAVAGANAVLTIAADLAMADFLDAQRRCATTILAHCAGGGASPTATTALAAVAPGTATVTPPPRATPAQNAAWWQGLSPQTRQGVLTEHPELVGNLDGIPAEVRDRANRARLPVLSAQVDAQFAAATAAWVAAAAAVRTRGPNPTAGRLRAEVDRLQRQKDALTAITTATAPAGRQLLLLDVSGHATPRAAVAVGDVDTARHVAVFTPGLNTTVAGDLLNYTNDMSGLAGTAHRQLINAHRPDNTVAAVAWLGYDAPQAHLTLDPVLNTSFDPARSVALPIDAQHGGADLARFYDGINAARPDHTHLTAIGHSYGSTTTGYALQHTTTPVDDAIVFGSPGLGTDKLSAVHVPAGHTAVIAAPGDPVADLGAFGADPTDLAGITHLAGHAATSPDGTALHGSHGHSEYLTPGTTSQYNIAATVAGLPENRVTGTDPEFFDIPGRGVAP